MLADPKANRLVGRWAPIAAVAAALGATTYVAAVDPNAPGHYPTCPLLAVTGHYCPGCGSLRMIHALAHGHVGEAFGRNPLAFLTLPFLAYACGVWAVTSWRGRPVRAWFPGPMTVALYTVVVVVFWVARNLPFGRALAP